VSNASSLFDSLADIILIEFDLNIKKFETRQIAIAGRLLSNAKVFA
jgi:hypothetical protein